MGDYALEVTNLTKKFSDFTLDDISFKLPKGYIMGFVGRNGAGKTTTINLITSLYHKDAGEVRIDGNRAEDDKVLYKESIGYIGDESYFHEAFKIKDIVSIQKDFYPTFREAQYMQYIEQWELPTDKKIGEFSKGMKVKLMFAGVLARDTRILLLDEATSGLDPITRDEVLVMLQKYIEDGERSVLFSTHILEDLEKIADYVFFIEKGREVFCDYKDQIMEAYRMVKGGTDELTSELEKEIIGLQKSSVGFQGIVSREVGDTIGDKFLVEQPAINDIIVAFQKNMGGNHTWVQ